MASAPPASIPSDESRHLLEYWYVLVRRRRLAVGIFVLIVAVTSIRSFTMRPQYSATAQLLIERETPKVLTFKEVTDIQATWGDEYYQTQHKLLQSPALARKVVEDLNLLQDPEFGGPRDAQEVAAAIAAPAGESALMEGVVGSVLSRLKIQLIRNSRIVTVTATALRPELSASMANKLCALYILQSLEFRYRTSAEAAQWLRAQIDDQRRKVEAAEIALQKLKESEGIVNIEERRSLLEQRLRELGTALTKLKTDRLQKQALFAQMRGTRNPEELPQVLASPVVQALRIELARLDSLLAQLQERYLDQHPEVVKTRNQIVEVRQRIAAEAQRIVRAAENDYQASDAQESNVAGALEAAKAETLDLSRRAVQYDSLKRELDAGKEVLNSLLERIKQTDVAQELKASNIRVVDPAAVPQSPIRPRHRADVTAGVLFGLVFSVALAFFLEYLDNTLKTPEDVRVHLGAPLLSVIPENNADRKGRLFTDAALRGPFVEGYRLLRTALNYSWAEKRTRSLLLTSTAPSEGKTLTAVNLAYALAFGEGRVLLMDCDLRKSQAHALLQAKRAPGLSDVLVGRAKPSEAIQRPAGLPFNILASGSPVPSPADLLSTDALRGLLQSLRSFYDWIVVDTPPVAAVADALVLAPIVDGVVVVVGAEQVPRKAVRHTLERVTEAGGHLLGIVLNRIQTERFSYYYGRYYGHYSYGHYHDGYVDGKRAEVARMPRRA